MSTREIALAFWAAVVLAAALRVSSVRESLWEVVKSFFQWKLLLIWGTLTIYVLCVVWAFRNVGYWNTGLLKETTIWFVFTAFAYPFQFHKDDDGGKARTIAGTVFRNAVSVLIIIQLLVDTYTFHLAVELVLVPLMTLIVLMGAFAQQKDEHRPVATLMGGLQVLLGATLVFLAIRAAVRDPSLEPMSLARELALPVFLSIGTIPYIYMFKFWLVYDDLPWRFGGPRELPTSFRYWAASALMVHARFHPTNVRAFLGRHGFRLHRIRNKDDLRLLLRCDRQGTPFSDDFQGEDQGAETSAG